jgi:type I restriction enzyme S subunit
VTGEEFPFFKVKHLEDADSDGRMSFSEHTVSASSAARLGAFTFPTGTIVFAKVGAALLLNRFRYVGQPSCLDNNMMGLVLDSGRVLLRFALYALSLVDLGQVANPGAVPSVNAGQVGDLAVSFPPLGVQKGVSEYLDREASRIDELVVAKQRVLDLLAEKRQSIIASAVVRGLNSNAPMQDSDIPWLGQVPSHWEIERARWLFRERDIRSETGEEEMLTVSHITGVTPRSEKDVNMFEPETTEGYKICLPGDLVINTLWAWMGAMGVAPLKGIVSPAYNVYTTGPRLEPSYVDALVRLPAFAQEVTRYSKGVWSSRLRLYPEGFFEVYFPVPPREEQRAIVEHIARDTAKIDSVHAATERTVALLKERRSALISAAVTGQIDVEAA